MYRGGTFSLLCPCKICDDNLGGFSQRSMVQFLGRGRFWKDKKYDGGDLRFSS